MTQHRAEVADDVAADVVVFNLWLARATPATARGSPVRARAES